MLFRLIQRHARPCDLRFREGRIREHSVVARPRFATQDGFQSAVVFPRHVGECRLSGDVADGENAFGSRVKRRVDCDVGPIVELHPASRAMQRSSVRRAADRREQRIPLQRVTVVQRERKCAAVMRDANRAASEVQGDAVLRQPFLQLRRCIGLLARQHSWIAVDDIHARPAARHSLAEL